MEVRLRLKIGIVEVDVEGSQEFVEAKFPALLSKVLEDNGWSGNIDALKASPDSEGAGSDEAEGSSFDHSTNTIASFMNAKTGPDLAMAACAHLSVVKGMKKFTRKEILDEMQAATAYYSHNYSGNLTKILQSLMKAKKINLVSSQTYSLPKSQIDEFVGLLEKE